MTRQALGRGLNALLSEAPMANNETMLEVEIDLIHSNHMQPRTRFNEARLEELAQSIRTNGIVQPLLVRNQGGRYQLVAGERRWRAAQIAGLRRVPVVVRDIPDEKMLELALIENIQRQELNAIEEAQAYRRLIETLNLTQEMVAHRVGRDRSFVTNYLRLLRLPEDIQALVEEEKISMGHARALLGVDDSNIQRQVAASIVERSLSVRETERIIKRIIEGATLQTATAPAQAAQIDANVRAAEAKIRRHFGTQVRIMPNGNGKGGKIEIEFYSDNDLDRIYNLLFGSQNGR